MIVLSEGRLTPSHNNGKIWRIPFLDHMWRRPMAIRKYLTVRSTSVLFFSPVLLWLFSVSTSLGRGEWSVPVRITKGGSNATHPAIANDIRWPLGLGQEEMVAYSEDERNICILHTEGSGTAWSDSVIYITNDSLGNDFPSLVHSYDSGEETAVIVWQGSRNGNKDIYYSKYEHGAWSQPQPITTDPQEDIHPHITQRADNDNSYAVWERQGTIYVSEYNGTIWSTPTLLSTPGDTHNHLPQVCSINWWPDDLPFVVWERQKETDTTYSIMCACRTDSLWSNPDTLIYAGNHRHPRWFKYSDAPRIFWEEWTGESSQCYWGSISNNNGRYQLELVDPLTDYPDNQRNASANGYIFITGLHRSPQRAYFLVAAWESESLNGDSIGASQLGISSNVKLAAEGATTNQEPEVSQGTSTGIGLSARYWTVWQANILSTCQLYASNTVVVIDDIAEERTSLQPFQLQQNYPNPFNPSTTISFTIPHASFVSLKVFDLLGREVTTLANETMNGGTYERTLDARELAGGIYLCQLKAGAFAQTRKLILLK
jgi:Secretion system C-terminal sorting domain